MIILIDNSSMMQFQIRNAHKKYFLPKDKYLIEDYSMAIMQAKIDKMNLTVSYVYQLKRNKENMKTFIIP